MESASSEQLRNNPLTPTVQRPVIDVRSFLTKVASGQLTAARSGVERPAADESVTIVDDDAAQVGHPQQVPEAFCDGIQAAVTATHVSGRPIQLAYVAAGAVTHQADLVGIDEDITVLCSESDVELVQHTAETSHLPVLAIAAQDPPTVERKAAETVRSLREAAERNLVNALISQGVQHLVQDGSLTGLPYHPGLVGVVKTTATRFLPDESQLWSLPVGTRSAIFRIGQQTHTPERYSAYLRLQPAQGPWDFGLIRVEAFTLDALLNGMNVAFAFRQSFNAQDARWDRHIHPIRLCEDTLRARRPHVFST